MASYLDALAAQVAEKRRVQESESLRDRAANLLHMGAAPFAGGPACGLDQFLADQGARIERAQAELDWSPRPKGGAQHSALQAAQPLDMGKMNSLFGAPSALLVALQAGSAAQPTCDVGGDAKSKRDEMWERKRQQRMQRQHGQALAPGGGGDGGAAEAKSRRDEIYEQKRREFLQRQQQPDEARAGPLDMPRSGWGERSPAVTETADEQNERQADMLAMQQEQQQYAEHEYAAALQEQMAAKQRSLPRQGRQDAPSQCSGRDGGFGGGFGGGNEGDGRRRQQQEYAAALQEQMDANKRGPQRQGRPNAPLHGGGGDDGLGDSNEVDPRRWQQQEYAAALEQQRHERAHKKQESRECRQSEGGGDVFGGANEGDSRRRLQQEHVAALQMQTAAKQRGPPWQGRQGAPPHGGGGDDGFGGGFNGGSEIDLRRRQQQEYAAALEQQRYERVQQMRESLERRQRGGGDVFGGANDGDARRRRQQQEHALALQEQMGAKARKGRRASDFKPGGIGGLGGSFGETDRQRRQQEYARALDEQMRDRKWREQQDKLQDAGSPGQMGQPGQRRLGGGLLDKDLELDVAGAQQRQREYGAQLAQQVQQADSRKWADKERRGREMEQESRDEGLFGQGFGRGGGGGGAPMRDVHGRAITNLKDPDAVRSAAAEGGEGGGEGGGGSGSGGGGGGGSGGGGSSGGYSGGGGSGDGSGGGGGGYPGGSSGAMALGCGTAAPPVGGFRRGLLDPTAPEDVVKRERARQEMAEALAAQVAEKVAKQAAMRAEDEREAVRKAAFTYILTAAILTTAILSMPGARGGKSGARTVRAARAVRARAS